MIPTLLQITEAAEHAPRIIEAARPLADTDRGLVLGVIILLGFFLLGFFVLAVILVRGAKKYAPDGGEVSAGFQGLARLPEAIDGGFKRLEGKIDTLTERVDTQGDAVPARVAEELAERVRIGWQGSRARVKHTPAEGNPVLSGEHAKASGG